MKPRQPADIIPKRARRPREPVEVRLTVRFKFGDEPGEVMTMMNDRRVPMVDNVFKSRDRILRGFTTMLMRAGAAQPAVARELLPLLRLLKPRGGKRRPPNEKN